MSSPKNSAQAESSAPGATQPTKKEQSPAGRSPIPLFDLSRQTASLQDEIVAALAGVCRTGQFILGPECSRLEAAVAAYCGARHAVGCASGSDALLLALAALDVGAGDEVIVPSYTFFATASAVTRLGARPVFVDIDPHTYNLDPGRIRARITSATKAIIPVHLFGQCAEMDSIQRIAAQHGLAVVEDACQAIGAEFRGRRAGVLGRAACFSFYPTKNLGGFGDGGMLTTDDERLADRLRLFRAHGMQPRYYHQVVGINSRLDSLQAAVLNVKLAHLESWTARRQALAARYAESFSARGAELGLGLPETAAGRRHVWNQFVVRVPDGHRDALRRHLAERGVGTEIYYPVPLHLQECFRYLGYPAGSLPETERAAGETLALPIFPELTEAEQDVVVEEIAAFLASKAPKRGHELAGPKFLKAPSASARRRAT